MANAQQVDLGEALSYITRASSEYGVDSLNAQAILLSENMGPTGEVPQVLQTGQISPRGAAGLMQVMPATRQALVDQGFLSPEYAAGTDWQSNVHAGLAALKEIQKRRKTTDYRVIGADYNAGPKGGDVVLSGDISGLPTETLDYLKRLDIAHARLVGTEALPKGSTIREQRPATRSTVTTTQVAGADAITQILRDNAIHTRKSIEAITQSTEAERAAQEEAAAAAVFAGSEAAQAEQIRASIEAAATQTRERILGILNLDTRQADNVIAEKTAEFNTLDPARKQMDATIDEKEAVGFFDNPLQYLINQTMLPGMLAQRNAVARKQNEAFAVMRAMQGVAEQQERIDISASADQIAQLGIHVGNVKVSQANAAAAESKARAASATARAVITIANLTERELDNKLKVAQWNRVVQSDKEVDQLKEREKADLQELDDRLARLGALVGAPGMNSTLLKRMSKKEQQEWMERAASNNIGNDLYEAATWLKPGWIANMKNSGSAQLAEFIRNTQSAMFNLAQMEAAKIQIQGGKIPSREELLRSAARSLESEFFAARNNMMIQTPNSALNPYKARHGVMATAWKGDPENAIYKIVRDGAVNKLRYNDSTLFTTIYKMVESGALSPADAARQMSDYYTAAVDENNRAYSFHLYGMSPQDDYKVLPKESKKTVNLLAPAELENLFTLARIRVQGAPQGFVVPEGYEFTPYPSGFGGYLKKQEAGAK
jgi:hypothetical protein